MSNDRDTPRSSDTIFGRQFELLRLELSLIDSAIRSQDDITKSIKNWAIVTRTASIGFAIANPLLKDVLWMTAVVPLAFWTVHGAFRRVQRSFIVRLQEIADFLNSPAFAEAARSGTEAGFSLMQMRAKSGPRTEWARVMLFRTVCALYLLMIAGSLLVWILLRCEIK